MSRSYFNKLNYSLANEDTRMEVDMLPFGTSHVMAVCGSGGRVLPLLSKAPQTLSFVDLSQEQLWLAEMRVAALRAFEHDEFLSFLGYPPNHITPGARQAMFARLELSTGASNFLGALFEGMSWNSILLEGKWERTFCKMASIAAPILGNAARGVMECVTLEEQQEYMQRHFPRARWELVLALLGNASVFNAMLYKGHFPSKNLSISHRSFYRNAYAKLFARGLARENFFLQLAFLGCLRHPEGNPVECDPAVFAAAKKHVESCQIRYRLGSILDVAAAATKPIGFLSLSDVPSYFSGRTEKEFMQRIRPTLAPNSLTVVRSYLHIPERPILSGFENVTDAFLALIESEKTQMYVVDVYRSLPV